MCVLIIGSCLASTSSGLDRSKLLVRFAGGELAKVLLVEDNEMNRDMLSRRLTRKGYLVVVAKDGLDGVSMAGSEAPDIILMDMSLPEIDGWEATRRIKRAPETASIPVIALTAHAMASDREKALAAGCDDFDTKPVELSRLLEKMERLLPAL
ncbi:response regulator [Ruegeria atlantica]|uniref:response regulator n=1 Tax=Ruegeria atlantica TaxID=81569 RepID=UPI001C2BD7E3|nr:response regulator [Ruegeria atlantica]